MRPNVQNWLARSLYESPLVYIESVDFVLATACSCITFTYSSEELEISGEVTFSVTGTENERNVYEAFDLVNNYDFRIVFNGTNWQLYINLGEGEFLQGILENNSLCPVGDWKGFDNFEVAEFVNCDETAVTESLAQWSYEPVNVTNETSRQKVPRRDGLLAERVQIKRTFDYQSQIL